MPLHYGKCLLYKFSVTSDKLQYFPYRNINYTLLLHMAYRINFIVHPITGHQRPIGGGEV
jgi:hypothetical protein